MTANTQLAFRCITKDDIKTRDIAIENLIIAGWTGRDKAAVEHHIAELEALGIARPKRTPCYYRVSVDRLTMADTIQAVGTDSSGEVEYFVLSLDDGLWVGLGSDHTDRKVEAYNVTVSKQMCVKPIAADLWPLAELADHWDDLQIRSWIQEDGERRIYQEGQLAAMLPPAELIAGYAPPAKALPPGTLMFCGTVAVQGGVRSAQNFEFELFDPHLDRTIAHHYRIEQIPEED